MGIFDQVGRVLIRTSVAVLATLAAVVLVACGGASSSGASAHEQKPSRAHPATLTVWDWDYFAVGLRPYLSIIDKQFEALHPGVTINHVPIPYESAPEKYHAAVSAQQGPDVITMYSGAYSAPFRQGLIPLDERISAAQRGEWQWLEDAVAPNGHTYVIPFGSEGYGVVYNKKLMAQAHVTPPATWAEWLSSCEKLKAAGITPQSGGWKEGEHFSDYFQVFSDALMTPAERKKLYEAKLPLTSPKLETAMKDVLELQKHGCFNGNAASFSLDEADQNFAAGKDASVLQSLAFGPLSKDGLYPKNLGVSNLAVAQVPPPPGAVFNPFMSSGPRSGWAITRWSQHQDLAWEYISYVMRRQSFELGFKKVEILPNVRSFTPTSSYPPAHEYLKWLKWPNNNSGYSAYPQNVYEAMTRQAAPLMAGTIQPHAVLELMEAQEQQDRASLNG